jgi:hypothetical protein
MRPRREVQPLGSPLPSQTRKADAAVTLSGPRYARFAGEPPINQHVAAKRGEHHDGGTYIVSSRDYRTGHTRSVYAAELAQLDTEYARTLNDVEAGSSTTATLPSALGHAAPKCVAALGEKCSRFRSATQQVRPCGSALTAREPHVHASSHILGSLILIEGVEQLRRRVIRQLVQLTGDSASTVRRSDEPWIFAKIV